MLKFSDISLELKLMPYSFLNLKYRVNLKPHLPPISYRVNKRIVKGKGKHGLSHARERMGNIWGLYNGIQKAWVLARKQLVPILETQSYGNGHSV